VAALFGCGAPCTWKKDMRRQALNVYRMKCWRGGVPVLGEQDLEDAIS